MVEEHANPQQRHNDWLLKTNLPASEYQKSAETANEPFTYTQIEQLGQLYSVPQKDDGEDSHRISALYTYFGQFIAHDLANITDAHEPTNRQYDSHEIPPNDRANQLSLSTIYGADSQGVNTQTGLFDTIRAGNVEVDIPRDTNGVPLIPDSRNDQNLLIAQFHLQWLRYHNYLVRQHNYNFADARRSVIGAYHYLVVHDFLKKILYQPVWELFFARRGSLPLAKINYRELNAKNAHSIPAAFHAAAFRFGHTMVRPSYVIQPGKKSLALAQIFAATHHGAPDSPTRNIRDLQISNNQPLRQALRVNWSSMAANHALILTGRQNMAIPHLPPPMRRLVTRNLIRGYNYGVADAQAYIKVFKDNLRHVPGVNIDRIFRGFKLGKNPLFGGMLDKVSRQVENWQTLVNSTPLWFYIQREANHFRQKKVNGEDYYRDLDGLLGPLGSLIVGQVFLEHLPAIPPQTQAPTLPGSSTPIETIQQLITAMD